MSAIIANSASASRAALSATYAVKILPGSDLVRAMPSAAVMDTLPTITASSAAPAGMTVTKNAYSGFSTYWPGFRVSGAPLFPIGSNTSYARNARKLDDAASAWGGAERIEFDFDGQAFAVRWQNIANAYYKVWADGRPTAIAALTSVSGASGSGTHHYKFDFGSRAARRIVVEWAALSSGPTNFSGIVHAPSDTVSPPVIPSPRFMVLGDSYGYGIGATSVFDSFAISLGRLLGFADVWNFASVPSTGVLKTNTDINTGPYSTRLAVDVIPYMRAGDVLVYQGSINDTGSTSAAITAQATADLLALGAALPFTQIIVTSPLWVATPTTPYTDIRTAMAAAATATSLPFVDVLDATLALFKGTGTVGATTGDGNADYYRNADTIHPNSAGHLALARALAAKIAPLIGQTR
jgi:lysophospholipase L1-like esterase